MIISGLFVFYPMTAPPLSIMPHETLIFSGRKTHYPSSLSLGRLLWTTAHLSYCDNFQIRVNVNILYECVHAMCSGRFLLLDLISLIILVLAKNVYYASPVYGTSGYIYSGYAAPDYASLGYVSHVYAAPDSASHVYASPGYISPGNASPVYMSRR